VSEIKSVFLFFVTSLSLLVSRGVPSGVEPGDHGLTYSLFRVGENLLGELSPSTSPFRGEGELGLLPAGLLIESSKRN